MCSTTFEQIHISCKCFDNAHVSPPSGEIMLSPLFHILSFFCQQDFQEYKMQNFNCNHLSFYHVSYDHMVYAVRLNDNWQL